MSRHIVRSALIVALLSIIGLSFPISKATASPATLPTAQAAPGSLDSTFGGFTDDGTVIATGMNYATNVVLQPDGKIVMIGGTDTADQLAVFRYLPNGQLDTSFAGDGTVILPDMFTADAVALQSDGRIVVGGSRDDHFHLARLKPNGALDTSFDGDGWAQDEDAELTTLNALLVQPDGKIVACGRAFVGGNSDFGVTRYTAYGARDTAFSGDGKLTIPFGEIENCQDVVQQNDGKLVVVGPSFTFTDADFAVARLNSDGTLDHSLDGDGKLTTGFGSHEYAKAVALQPDGKIVVIGAGSFGPSYVARYLPNGALDTSFDGDGKLTIPVDVLSRLVIQPDGKLVALGYHTSPSGDSKVALHRLNANGTSDTTFGDSGVAWFDFGSSDYGTGLALLPDSRFLAVGSNGTAAVLVRVWPDGTPDTGGQQVHSLAFPPAFQPGYRESANALALLPGGAFVVAGQFFNPQFTASYPFVTRFMPDGTADPAFGTNGSAVTYVSGLYSAARAVAVQPDSKIVIAGYTAYNKDYSAMDFLVARFLPTGAPDQSFGVGGVTLIDFAGGADGATALALAPDGKIVVAGNYSNGGVNSWGITRLTTTGRPDLTFDTDGKASVQFINNNAANAVAVQPDGKIIVGGTAKIQGSVGNGDFFLQRLLVNGKRDPSYGINGGGYNFTDLGGTDAINALALAPNGWLYAAGYRVSSSANSDIALAQYTPDGKLAACIAGQACYNWPGGTFFVNAGINDYAYALDLRGDNQLVAAGCTNGNFAGVQVRTDGVPTPQPFTTDFVGTSECARAVKFVGADKVVMAGEQDLYPFSRDSNMALARFQTTTEVPTPVPAAANLLVNPGFELDDNHDTRPDGWPINAPNANVTRDASVSHSGYAMRHAPTIVTRIGGYSMRHAPTNVASYTVGQVVPNIKAGATYTFGGYINIPSTSDTFTFQLEVRWRSASNSVISTSPLKRFSAATNGWVGAAADLQAPVGATNAIVAMVATSLQATVYVDDMSFALSNLLHNGTFEADTNGDTRPDDWSSNSNVTRNGSVKHSGAYAMRHRSTTNASYIVAQQVSGLTAGRPYVFEGWVNIPLTSDTFTFELRVSWRSTSGAVVRSDIVKTYSDDSAGAWTRAAQVLIAPPGATQANLQMLVTDLSATIYTDDVVLRP